MIATFYHDNYKKLLVLSLAILLASIIILGVSYARTGEFAQQSVSLKGGMTITVLADKQYDIGLLSDALPDFNVRALEERGKQKAIVFESVTEEEATMLSQIRAVGVTAAKGTYTTEFLGSSLGEKFYRQTITAIIVAFLAMSAVVFITFRSVVPSSFVILAAASDIISTLAVISLLGVKLSTAGIAAFLMLIGYSVDTDILLTTRVLKRKEGTLKERIGNAARTGLTMSITSLAAVLAAYFFSSSDTIKQIMLVISIGLVFDIIYTWLQNAAILRLYLERKQKNEP